MKAPPFAYARAESVGHALELMTEAGDDAKLLAGGQSLLPLLVHRVVRPSHVVDIDALGELTGTSRDERGLVLGALTRHAELERLPLEGRERILGHAASQVGHAPIRSRGTLGGSVAHADPAAELPLALLALDAQVVVRSGDGERRIPVADFVLGPFTTALDAAEILVGVAVPPAAREGVAAFAEIATRPGDFALAAVAATAVVEDGCLRDLRIALGGVEATPIRARAAEAALDGEAPSDAAIAVAAAAAAAECEPIEDHATTAEYRRTLVARLVRDTVAALRDAA